MPRDGGEIAVVSGAGDGQQRTVAHLDVAIPAIIASLVALQQRRKFCIKAQGQITRQVEGLIASSIGFRIDADDEDRKKVFAQAKKIRLEIERDGECRSNRETQWSAALAALAPMILIAAATRKPWDDMRKAAEKEMEGLAAKLPVAVWAKEVRGFGPLSLALLLAEAGRSLDEYATVSKLWKRLGLAVISGERQRRKTNKAAAEQHGYSPRRRAEVYVVGSVGLFMGQKAGMRYRSVYDHRKAATAPRIAETADLPYGDPLKWTPRRCDNDARRVMTKALVRDLWIEWRKSVS